MQRYTQLPFTLYRIQTSLPVNLRDYDSQMAKGRASFDLKLDAKGFVQPVAIGSRFVIPNGMSLRPASEAMIKILKSFRGNPKIYHLLCGIELPKGFVVYHEHTDHYSLQTTEPKPIKVFNKELTEFLNTLPVQSREQFLNQIEDIDDQDS